MIRDVCCVRMNSSASCCVQATASHSHSLHFDLLILLKEMGKNLLSDMFEEDSILQLDLSFGRTTPTTRVKLILSRIMSNPISIDMYLFSLQSDCE